MHVHTYLNIFFIFSKSTDDTSDVFFGFQFFEVFIWIIFTSLKKNTNSKLKMEKNLGENNNYTKRIIRKPKEFGEFSYESNDPSNHYKISLRNIEPQNLGLLVTINVIFYYYRNKVNNLSD